MFFLIALIIGGVLMATTDYELDIGVILPKSV